MSDKSDISIKSILFSPSYWVGAGLIFSVQLAFLLGFSPVYAIDSFAYTAGGFSWSIYHAPLTNIFIALISVLSRDLYLILGSQMLIYGLAGSFLANVLFRNFRWVIPAILLAAIEPVTAFYNCSLLSESLFTSLLMIASGITLFWIRTRSIKWAILTGLSFGLAFTARLSGIGFLPLLVIIPFLLPFDSLKIRLRQISAAAGPFLGCVAIIWTGHLMISGTGLFEAGGRVLWDFSSSQYSDIDDVSLEGKKWVDPFILSDGKMIKNRELRREQSYLGFKECTGFNMNQGMTNEESIQYCDEVFGQMGREIMIQRGPQAGVAFMKDNFIAIHRYNYLDYRFTEGLPFEYQEEEYLQLDRMIREEFQFPIERYQQNLPFFWRDQGMANVFGAFWFWILWLMGWMIMVWYLRKNGGLQAFVLALIVFIPLSFQLFLISYRLRFMAPVIVIGGMLLLYWVSGLLKKQAPTLKT